MTLAAITVGVLWLLLCAHLSFARRARKVRATASVLQEVLAGDKFKELVKKELKKIQPPPTPPSLEPPRERFHPKRCDGTLRLRVYTVGHTRRVRMRRYQTLTENHSNYMPTPFANPMLPPLPDIAIHSGWLYVNGENPCVGTAAVVAQAEGCQLLLQHHSETATGGARYYHRVYYLEGDPDEFVWVHPRKVSNDIVAVLSVGTYVDAQTDVDGSFTNWRGVAPGAAPLIETFAPTNNAVYEQIHEDVERCQEEEGMG